MTYWLAVTFHQSVCESAHGYVDADYLYSLIKATPPKALSSTVYIEAQELEEDS